MARTSVALGSTRRGRSAKKLISNSTVSTIKQNLGGYNFKNLARKIKGNPMMLNLGIGVGAYFLVRFAIKYYKSHPEILEFIKENFDAVEEKIREYRGDSVGSTSDSELARH